MASVRLIYDTFLPENESVTATHYDSGEQKNAQGWKWMQQNQNTTAEAEHGTEENKEDRKDVHRILYRSDARYYGKTTSLSPGNAMPAADSGSGHGIKLRFHLRICVQCLRYFFNFSTSICRETQCRDTIEL